MKKRSLLFFILFAVLASAAFLTYVKWNRPHENVEDIAGISVNAGDLFLAFSENETLATKAYNGKIIEVTGVVSAIESNLEGRTIVQLQTNDPIFGVNCTMEKETALQQGQTVTIKGVCSGFTTDVILIRCYLINKTT
jgi:tRNA_anti-like